MISVPSYFKASAAALCVAGCAPQYDGPDAHELSNFDQRNLVPKSTGQQLVRTFERACMDGGFATGRAMRDDGFVPLPDKPQTYVSDDKRPQVIILGGKQPSCGVFAASRTGQTEALNEIVAQRMPQAEPVSERTRRALGVEQAWMVDGDLVYLERKVRRAQSTVLFSHIRKP